MVPAGTDPRAVPGAGAAIRGAPSSKRSVRAGRAGKVCGLYVGRIEGDPVRDQHACDVSTALWMPSSSFRFLCVIHEPTNRLVDDLRQQPPQALLSVIHAGPEVCHDLERPALPCPVAFQYLFLAFQVILLITAGHARVRDRLAVGVGRCPKLAGAELCQIVVPATAQCLPGYRLAGGIPLPRHGDRLTKDLGGLADAYKPVHIGSIYYDLSGSRLTAKALGRPAP